MQGRLVTLARPTDDEYHLMAEWLSSSAPIAPLTGDLGADHTAEDLKALNGANGYRLYTVRLPGDGTAVGCVNFRREAPGCFSLGGAVGDPALWEKGYAADALMVLVDHLFHSRNARKVQVVVMSFNKASMRLLTRSGFVCEGILREHCYLDGEWHDAVQWSMLRAEFYAQAARDGERSSRLALRDLVPAEDKAEARRILADHLRTTRSAVDLFAAGQPAAATAGTEGTA